MISPTFVIEQHVGHRTFYQNLRRFVDPSTNVDASWVEVTYFTPKKNSLWETIPMLPASIQGTLVGRSQVRTGLKRCAGDVAFFFTQVPAAIAGGLIQKRPYVVSTDITPIQYDEMGHAYNHKASRNKLLKYLKHRHNVHMLQNAARLLPWSNWVRESLIKDYGVADERIEVLPIGVDTTLWQPDYSKANEGPFRILFVGRDFYPKGGQVLVDAFQQLPPGTAELNVVTRTPLELGENIRVFNNLHPNTPELRSLFQQCDVFVLPTQSEAFGIVAVEASASGAPVLASDLGALPEIIKEGETGFLFPVNDGNVLLSQLQFLIADRERCRQMGRAARKHVETFYDGRKNAHRIIEILCETVSTAQ